MLVSSRPAGGAKARVFLIEHAVSIVNPTAIKGFGQSDLSRTETRKGRRRAHCTLLPCDEAAALGASEPVTTAFAAFGPPSRGPDRDARPRRKSVARTGRERGSRVDRDDDRVKIAEIDAEIAETIDQDPTLRANHELLESIPGIGERVATTLLGELPTLKEFCSGKAVAALVGLSPREFRSGSSVSASWVSKAGNSHVRRVLYMPALGAMRFNSVLIAFSNRLRANGKRPKQIIVAVMRRLLVIAYGVLKSGKPFEMALNA